MKDGGGGSSAPKVTSSVSVDPGEIRAFAKFLDEMHEELVQITETVRGGTQVPASAFGVYSSSATAAQRHSATLTKELANLDALVARLAEIATQTTSVSRTYSDLEELNSTNGDSISLHMRASAPTK